MDRPTCEHCQSRPAALNYVRNGKRHYRRKCLHCINKSREEASLESQVLNKSGYQKRNTCDRCGFQAKHPSQLSIVYLDGNKLNVGRQNLRTYCANCVAEIVAVPASRSGLVADF